jgi:glycosyltransferase involved in cell wall biosynthesis
METHNNLKEHRKSGVEVILPVFNGQDFIIDALRSVDAQTYPIDAVFVIDDGSTDATGELVKHYAQNSRYKIVYIKTENKGEAPARNKGLAQCSREFVAFIDADDMWHKEKIEKQMNLFLNASDQMAIVYCHFSTINKIGEAIQTNEPIFSFRGDLYKELLSGTGILPSQVVIRRKIFDDIGLFDEGLPVAPDWDMWLRISKKYHFDFVPAPLVIRRKHDTNITGRKNFPCDFLYLLDKWIMEFIRQGAGLWLGGYIQKHISETPGFKQLFPKRIRLSTRLALYTHPKYVYTRHIPVRVQEFIRKKILDTIGLRRNFLDIFSPHP